MFPVYFYICLLFALNLPSLLFRVSICTSVVSSVSTEPRRWLGSNWRLASLLLVGCSRLQLPVPGWVGCLFVYLYSCRREAIDLDKNKSKRRCSIFHNPISTVRETRGCWQLHNETVLTITKLGFISPFFGILCQFSSETR